VSLSIKYCIKIWARENGCEGEESRRVLHGGGSIAVKRLEFVSAEVVIVVSAHVVKVCVVITTAAEITDGDSGGNTA
jgi:hypothetical protein